MMVDGQIITCGIFNRKADRCDHTAEVVERYVNIEAAYIIICGAQNRSLRLLGVTGYETLLLKQAAAFRCSFKVRFCQGMNIFWIVHIES